MASRSPLVGIVMGSASDWEVMREAARQLDDFAVPYEAKVLSAHRSPDALFEWVGRLSANGVRCFIAGAGGAAHLAGVVAAKTIVPVLGVPMPSKYLQGLDSLLSMVQMPKGIPVATLAIGEAGAANAGLFAVAMLAQGDPELARRLVQFRSNQAKAIKDARLPE
jgi:5-(carboxyamino)imidazole ribonucleotide mutase